MQLKIDRQLVPDQQPDILHFRIEARGKSLDLVIAGLEISYVVLAVGIRPYDPPVPKLRLPDSESRVRHDSAGNIPDYSSDSSFWSLRQESVLEQNEQCKNNVKSRERWRQVAPSILEKSQLNRIGHTRL
jgi:hypothetical protein